MPPIHHPLRRGREILMQPIVWQICFVLVLCLTLCSALPLTDALEFGSDEGYELMKALLVVRGYELYVDIWSDQPPLFTGILSLSFMIFGESLFVARTVAVVLTGCLLFSFMIPILKHCGILASFASVIFLLSWPGILALSVSAMVETPTMMLGLASLVSMVIFCEGRGTKWLVTSGLLFGLALQTKLTVLLVYPSIMLYLWLGERTSCWRRSWRSALYWHLAAIAAAVLVCVFFPFQLNKSLFTSHFSDLGPEAANIRFQMGKLHTWGGSYSFLILAVFGLLRCIHRRTSFDLAVLTLLSVTTAIHSLHTPHWYYYTLHLALPVCWLMGFGFSAIVDYLVQAQRTGDRAQDLVMKGCAIILCTAVLHEVGMRGAANLVALRNTPTANNDVILQAMNNLVRPRWIFADRVIYPFHRRLLVPPPVAVLPRKRIWSGQITTGELIDVIESYEPEALVICSTNLLSPETLVGMPYFQPLPTLAPQLWARKDAWVMQEPITGNGTNHPSLQ